MPVGELMVADSAGLQNAQTSMAQQLAAAAALGESAQSLNKSYQWAKDRWGNDETSEAVGEGEAGRGVRYASGGAAYLRNEKEGQPVGKESYLTDTLESQKDEDREMLKPTGGTGNTGGGGLGGLLSGAGAFMSGLAALSDRRAKHSIRRIGKTDHGLPIYSFKYKGDDREQTHIGFMADEVEDRHPGAVSTGPDGMKRVDYDQAHKFYQGGVVRPGYQVGGAPDEDRRMTAAELLAAASEGSMPQAARERLNATEAAPAPVPTGGVVPPERPAQTPMPMTTGTGLSAAEMPPVPQDVPSIAASPRPQPRPAGLVPAPEVQGPPVAPAVGQPVSLPGGVADGTVGQPSAPRAPAGVAGIDPSSFYRTQILKQESGYRQFDENGNPLTSPKGAVGIGQVMEDTGPEAAKLAGLEWDRDRWLNDPEYNAAIGEAYFLEQYRRFGSLDKAAAAYNAGPGALSSALDRAAALGGSYLDYLPNETQNYVLSTTGGAGVSGGAPTARDDRGLGAGMLTSDKPYEERTMLGKMAYDRDGNLNKDFVMSVLSGLGTMASSPSLYLGSAMLQGLGGFANTYGALETARGEKTAKALENAKTFMQRYMQAQETGYRGTAEDYAREIEYKGPITGQIEYTPTTGGDRITSYNGVRLDPMGGALSMPTTVMVDGQPVQVMGGQSYGLLKAYEAKLARDVALEVPGAANTLAQVQAAIASHTGQITLPDGRTVTDPAYEATAFGANRVQSDNEQTVEIQKSIGADLRSAQEEQRNAAELAKALSMLPSTGNLSPTFALIGRVGQQLGFDVPTNATEGYDIATKVIAQRAQEAIQSLAGNADTNVVNNLISSTTPNPSLSPAANEELLAIQAGIADYNFALAMAMDEAMRKGTLNLAEAKRDFIANNSPADYIDRRRPEFKGTIKRPAESIQRPDDIPEDAWSVMTEEERRAVTGG